MFRYQSLVVNHAERHDLLYIITLPYRYCILNLCQVTRGACSLYDRINTAVRRDNYALVIYTDNVQAILDFRTI